VSVIVVINVCVRACVRVCDNFFFHNQNTEAKIVEVCVCVHV